ncbi:hypothetical protein BH23GEM9_BH23GEM9_10750 [soil metagenome]
MVRLRILGQAELSGADGAPLATASSQPKLLALLFYLALARRAGPARRDTLLGMFWPELDTRAARHALSQALTRLRRELGEAVLDGRYRESIGVSRSELWCDAAAFRDAAARGSHAEALGIYGGSLLDGFYLADAPDFERWLEDERSELNRLAVSCALRLSQTLGVAGQPAEARAAAERAIELDPYEEAAWRQLIACHDAAGDRATAVAVFRRMQKRLRDDLAVEPSPETLQLMAAVHARSAAHGHDRAPPPRHVEPAADPAATAVAAEPPKRARRGLLVAASVLIVLAIGWVSWQRTSASRTPGIDPSTVAVVPFRVTGLDSLSTWLEEGMVDLLALKLGVESGQRAVEPRAILHAWRMLLAASDHLSADWPVQLAARVGAGKVLSGSAIGTGESVTLSATLHTVPGGHLEGRATVTGSRDDLSSLVDHLAAQVLGIAAGEAAFRIESMATTSLPALHAYLAGRAAQRAGRYAESVSHFEHAITLDPTFALAGMGMIASSNWGVSFARAPGVRVAWGNRHRLSQRDSLRLLAMLGQRYPAPTPARDQIAFIERTLASTARDDAELWFELGDVLFHHGPRTGMIDWRERAGAAFQRALHFDSTFVPPVLHLIELAADARETTQLRGLVAWHLRHSPAGEGRDVYDWFLRAMAGLSSPGMVAKLSDSERKFLINLALSYAVGLEDADSALRMVQAHAATAAERVEAARFAIMVGLARGRSNAVHEAWVWVVENDSANRRNLQLVAPFYALYWNGSMEAAAHAARALAPVLTAPTPLDSIERRYQLAALCAQGVWQVHHQQFDHASGALATLRRAAADSLESIETVHEARRCATVLEVLLAEARGPMPDRALIERLDSVLTDLPSMGTVAPPILRVGNLLSARLWAERGELHRALRALGRRGHNTEAGLEPVAFLREECQLATRAGGHELAARACERFRALRDVATH